VSYYGNAAATDDRLRARLASIPPGSSIAGSGGTTLDTPHLRTGDLGFLYDGEVFVTGRLKDMIIIRGANYYPQDLEYTAQDACSLIRPGCCAAFAYEENGEERVGLVAEVPAYSDDVIGTIRNAISEVHGLRVHRVELVRQGTIPKTSSGKIQRQACKRGMLTGTLETLT
jgi:myxalamid-type polyketide synthase MxaE and MxaD